jgi:O-antigen ligase
MVRERPLLGWGPVDNQAEIAARVDRLQDGRRDAHNLVLELLTTTGLMGTVPFLIALGLCLGNAWRSRARPAGVLPLALLAGVLAGTVMGTWIASKILWLALAVAAGAPTAASAEVPDRSVLPCAA